MLCLDSAGRARMKFWYRVVRNKTRIYFPQEYNEQVNKTIILRFSLTYIKKYPMIVKWLIFLTTMGAMHSFTSLLTVYCYVKSDIGKEYAMGTIFIGVLDFCILIGQSLCTLFFTISVPFQPKRLFFFCCILQVFTFCLIGFVKQQQQFSHIFICAALVFFGFGRGSFMIPFFILSQQFDASKQNKKFTLWAAFVTTGYLFGFFVCFMFQLHQIGWDQMVLASSIYFMIWTILMQFSAEEVVVQKYITKKLKPSERAKILYSLLKQFLSSKINILFLLDICCMEIMVQTLLFWLPYYFAQSGFPQKGAIILIIGTILIFIGSPIVTVVKYFIQCIDHRWSVMFVIINLLCFLFLNIIEINLQNKMKVAVLIGISGFVFGSVIQHTTLFETKQKINYKSMDKALLYCLFKAIRGVISSIFMLIVGFILSVRLQTLLQILVVVSAAVVITHIKRVKYESQFYQLLQKKQSLQLKNFPQKTQSTDSFFINNTPLTGLTKKNTSSSLRRPLQSRLSLQ